MVVNRNELLIMCILRFPKLKIHFNSDFLHYKELYITIRSSLTEHIHLSVLVVISVSRSKNNAALVFVVSCEKGKKN